MNSIFHKNSFDPIKTPLQFFHRRTEGESIHKINSKLYRVVPNEVMTRRMTQIASILRIDIEKEP